MSGAGAHAVGGRWNSPGRYVVYTSGNLALAMLELLAHVEDAEASRRLPFAFPTVSFGEEALAVLDSRSLPSGWDSRPVSRGSQLVGDEWLERSASAVLAVPSVMIPEPYRFEPQYMNYLINPQHPVFLEEIETGEVLELALDQRLLP